jgi:hypothetical protein
MSLGLKANVDGSGAIQVGGTDAITLSTGLNATFVQNADLPNTFGFKNRILNGAMVIDQRNAGASVTPTDTGNNNYTLDRWSYVPSQASKLSIQQNAASATPPTGFTNYLGTTSLSAYSVTSTDYFNIRQYVEGYNASDLAWGTASAATVTLSFWVRSSLTGTFGGSVSNGAGNRCYPFSYTISSANTWEQKSVTIAGDTSGTWLTTNGIGIRILFSVGAGSTVSGTAGSWGSTFYQSATGATSVVGTNGATFYITGVQLEKGTTATSFDYRPYGTELALCQRYYEVGSSFYQVSGVSSSSGISQQFSVTKRSAATMAFSNITYSAGSALTDYTSSMASPAGVNSFAFYFTPSSNAGFVKFTWTASIEL